MKRIFSKLATIAFLSVITLTMAISASAATPDRLQPGEATLAFADSSWIISNWGATTDNEMVVSCLTNTTITGNGEYTVAVDLSSGVFALDDEGNPIVDEETEKKFTTHQFQALLLWVLWQIFHPMIQITQIL